jgi:hypothetical protein
MMRILVTGSRDWTDPVLISRHLSDYINKHCIMLHDENGHPTRRDWSDVVIVHGAARGADRLAASWAEHLDPPIKTEPHPVTPGDWEANPKIAGYMRNKHMVDLGADVCIAFLRPCRKTNCWRTESHLSHGGSHTADLAQLRGIETIRVVRGFQ